MRKVWTNEEIEEARNLLKMNSAREVGRMFNTSKNSILGVLYRDKVKKGYAPAPDSKFTGRKYRKGFG
tara:strand:+ start:10492 stop:10695 length:204 start_codon:yes stop_codon:yes gene_type:complete